jgi:2-succinyl-5-enolpyruvyl-6-hydroxy-3-cyclohexene-1-carboxylate synthase
VNVTRAAHLVEALTAAGVADWCVCPGGRNSPLVVVLDAARGITTHYGFEERSTAFFALGRARAARRPVAVVTTSGTAAAELLPAAVEAHYAGAPLILVTADRPPRYRGTGAPQAIEQPGLFGAYAPTVYDGRDDADVVDLSDWCGDHPVHVNVCFDEPLVDGPIPTLVLDPGGPARRARVPDTTPLASLLASARSLLAIVGPLDRADRAAVREWLVELGAPVYLEPASGLREDPALAELAFRSGERALDAVRPDAVLRVGGVPTVRFWRDLETRLVDIPVCTVSPLPFPGLTRGAVVHGPPTRAFRDLQIRRPERWGGTQWLERDRARAQRLEALFREEPASEPSLIRAVSAHVPAGALVYLGNSLPIREWDLAAARQPRDWDVAGNRGANGIDGQISTFFGMCAQGRDHWAIVGDLTTLYDLSAPWLLRGTTTGPIRIVIVNNGGGQIFARLSPHGVLRNPHAVTFADWARLWGLAYHHWTGVPGTTPRDDRCVIELAPEPDATERFWRAYDAMDPAP